MTNTTRISPAGDSTPLGWYTKYGGYHYVEIYEDPNNPDDEGTYVWVPTAPAGTYQDDYTMQSILAGTNSPSNLNITIDHIRMWVRCKKLGGTAVRQINVWPNFYTGATMGWNISGAYTWYYVDFYDHGSPGYEPITVSDIQNLVYILYTVTLNIHVTCCYVEVFWNYLPSPGYYTTWTP